MKRVVAAKEHHDATCSKGPALEFHMNPFDVERYGWEDGDTIAGLVCISDPNQTPDYIKVYCAGDGAKQEEEVRDHGLVLVTGGDTEEIA